MGRLKERIKFNQLRGYQDYREEMERVYPENAWVTPAELFKPYYGYTIANYILNTAKDLRKRSFQILEIGPGTGTMADSVLEFLKNYDLQLYSRCEYIFVEISPFLIQQCEALLKANHPKLYQNGQLKFYQGSILDYEVKQTKHTFVLGMEIMDNMPHDRLYKEESKD